MLRYLAGFAGWGKGCAFLNGFNLGRYWEIGPQKRLYIPGPLVKKGKNEIILFETDGKARVRLRLRTSRISGKAGSDRHGAATVKTRSNEDRFRSFDKFFLL